MSMSFREKLKKFRKAAGLSQAELSEKAGVEQSSVSRWERGDREPDWKAVQAVAKALGITCLDLTDDGSWSTDVEATSNAKTDPLEMEEVKKPKRTKKGNS